MVIKRFVIKLVFFWLASAASAIPGYYILLAVFPDRSVFISLYRMFGYHNRNPIEFILIPCFFYGILAAIYSSRFLKQNFKRQFLTTCIIVLLTVLLSSPVGGMLWYYHDMEAGFFLKNWISLMISRGFGDGLMLGWIIAFFSLPYSLLGMIVCYFITRWGSLYLSEKTQ